MTYPLLHLFFVRCRERERKEREREREREKEKRASELPHR
jgi:hypothetical protein